LPETLPSKTSEVAAWFVDQKHLLLVVGSDHKSLARSVSNLRGVRVMDAALLVPRDLVEAETVWVDEAALPVLESRMSKKS